MRRAIEKQTRIALWFLAVVLLAAQTVAALHDLEHAQHQLDEPACALVLHVHQPGGAPVDATPAVADLPAGFLILVRNDTPPPSLSIRAYFSRAPPSFFV